MKDCSTRASRMGYLAGVVTCGLFALAAAREVWPPMDGDASMLFPPAVEMARGNGLVNTPWIPPMNDTIDGPGGRRHISHGFLNQLLVGWAASITGSDAPQCIAWSYVVVLLAAAACGGAVLSWRGRECNYLALEFAFGFLLVAGFFALGFSWFGRSEPMAMLWIGCAALALRYCQSRLAFFFCGVALGLTAWTSPMSGLIGAFLFVVFVSLQPCRTGFSAIVLLSSGVVVATAASFALYPYTLYEWVGGTIRHSRIHFDHPNFQGLMQAWVARPHAPLLVLTFGLLAIPPFLRMACTLGPASWLRRGMIVAGVFALALLLFRLTVVRGEAAYNLAVLLPVLAVATVHSYTGLTGTVLVSLALLLPSLGLARSAVLLASQIKSGPAYSEVRRLIAEKAPEGLLVSKGLWTAVPELGKVTFGRPDFAPVHPRWFIDQQLATGRSYPLAYPGYRLVENKFSGPVRIGRSPISRAPTGWQYALYEKALPSD